MKKNGFVEYSPVAVTKPSEVFQQGRIYFSCEGGEPSLKNLVDRIGHKTLLFASDFPHESNIEHAMHDMEELLDREDLSDAAKQGIFCDNTLAYYGR
jgi:predicted TIM-barrel fold metal-dependent hydrolase